ncbi:NrfA- nitrite reduction protein [Meridianimarinicoccus roseus]|uniref:nitrite reductase (cytochrome; ammonia-forming) n=1 Tax=Meridianimarinicoccus roseus TaxID=2072018 RepID=A0A2V2LFK2_9RHOB|nr:cytochrome c3 family protein [Meridianimarinicoccus roseus]PWR01199.1 NrfA- nitrite reduction protein [Meridianimarinicoccus roseus]
MSTRLLWIIWIAASLLLASAALARLYIGGDRTAFLPGDTHGVHHQIELACESCHISDSFASQATVRKDINKTCVTCHKEELKASDDSHPIKKFKNPRMAAYWELIDARFCTSCHMEHQPEITIAGLVTLPGDFCVACHSEGEQDVRVNRASHADLTFETCASAGCHNFHDNRALYEDFLVKHADAPWLAPSPVHAAQAMARTRPRPDGAEIAAYLAAVDAPERARDPLAEAHWAASAHAAAEVGCGGCHAPKAETPAQLAADWTDHPAEAVCTECHRPQAATFAEGRHGMRRHPELAPPRQADRMLGRLGLSDPPEALVAAVEAWIADPDLPGAMGTAEARIPMAAEAHGQSLTCATCHAPHEQDLAFAAAGACLTCHTDDHSAAYEGSPHHALWQAEMSGNAAPGSGVSCATCHLPKTERRGAVTTSHNQSDTLRPNEKMIRPVCMDCHGLAFAIDALADPALVANNFRGTPDRRIESIDWATSRVDRPDEGANQ